ncbi:MAG: hypothetical protein GY874_17835 [Desulfobacteraceae bacterium]|nr:hypothetical protein [Desulfobacteraceae bacterium]
MRKTQLTITYNGADISKAIAPYVIEFAYTDNAHGAADEISVTVEDTKDVWKTGWFPQIGAKLTALLTSSESSRPGADQALNMGVFSIDSVSTSGPPDTVTFKAVSSVIMTSLRREKITKAWENIAFGQICSEVTSKHGFSCFYDSSENIEFKRVDQTDESDLAFLKRLADEQGMNIKVAHEKIILFAGAKYEAKAPSFTVDKNNSLIKQHSFETKVHNVFNACEISYFDPDQKQEKLYRFVPQNPPAAGHTLKINKRVESLAGAMRRAKNELRKANKEQIKGSLTFAGNPLYLAGLNLSLTGFGVFDANYFIETAEHSCNSSGYETSLTIRKVLDY